MLDEARFRRAITGIRPGYLRLLLMGHVAGFSFTKINSNRFFGKKALNFRMKKRCMLVYYCTLGAKSDYSACR